MNGGLPGKTRGKSSIPSVILSLLLAGIVLLAFFSISSSAGRMEKMLCQDLAAEASAGLAARLEKLLGIAERLGSAVEARPGMDERSFELAARSFMASDPSIIGVSLAPGAVIDRYYPVESGSVWKGHDLLSNPERRNALVKAAELKKPVITGPYESVDSGQVIFLRNPVYASGKLWGFASISADFSSILESLPGEEKISSARFALADVSSSGSPRFLGGRQDAIGNGVWAPLEAGGLQWRVYAVPALGWSGSDPYLYVLLGSGIMAAFFLFIALRRVGMRSAEEGIPTPEPGRRARPKSPLEDLLAAAYSKPPESGEGVAAGSPPDPHPDEPREEPETGGTTAPDQAVRRSASPNLHDTRTLSPSLFPDLALVEKKRGRPITFKGPAVKGDLFMPEHSGESAHTAPIQAAREQAEFPAAAHAPAEPQIPAPEPKPNPSRIQAQRLSQQDFFFSLEETTSPRSLPILVVDDSEANRDIVGRMLSLRGYSADFADSGEAALDMYVGKHYALVLVDTFMPGMDGYKTAAELRKARPGSKTLVAGMSARTGQAELEKCKAAGMDELLVKPFTLNQLIAIVEKARN